MSLVPPFDALFSDAEIQALQALRKTHNRIHPLVSVALHPGQHQTPRQVSINTARSLQYVLSEFPQWLQELKPRLIDAKDWTASESALAEIRACGALLEAGYSLRLGTRNTSSGAKPEFHVMVGNDETIVEVWTRNLGNSQLAQIQGQHKATSSTTVVNGGTLTSSVATVAPFGAPNPLKKGDSVLTNAISKIAAIKEREHQATDLRPFVIWVDLQSETTMMFEYDDHLTPLMSWNGIVASGAYWHALYGRKGDILLESDRPYNRTNVMLHDGRYYQTMKHGGPTRISAFLISSTKTTAVMENPFGQYSLTPAFRKNLLELPFFDISVSLANWSGRLVQKTVERQREFIVGVVATLGLAPDSKPSWYSKAMLLMSDWLDAVSRRLRSLSS